MLYPCRTTCSPASTQSTVVTWKNLVPFSAFSRYRFDCAFGGRFRSSFST